MEGTLMGELRASERVQLGLVLRCGVSAFALSVASIASPAWAQTDPSPAVQPQDDQSSGQSGGTPQQNAASDEGSIVITGIRASLRRSQDIKRESEVSVDSITAD